MQAAFHQLTSQWLPHRQGKRCPTQSSSDLEPFWMDPLHVGALAASKNCMPSSACSKLVPWVHTVQPALYLQDQR